MHTQRQAIVDAIGRGDHAAAERGCAAMMAVAETAAEGAYLQGLLHLSRAEAKAALPLLRRARDLLPDRGDILYNLGVSLQATGRLDEAAATWHEVTRLAPDHLDAWRNLTLAAAETGDPETARDLYRQALARHPEDRALLFNYARLCRRSGAADEGVAVLATLLRAHPRFAPGWLLAGESLKAAGRLAQAEGCYREAIALDDPALRPIAHFHLACLLLQQERWAEGFTEHIWCPLLPGAGRLHWPVPAWTGQEPPESRVLLWNDQGAGDAIQWLRLARPLADRGYHVFVLVQDQLKSLAASAPGVEAAFGTSDAPAPMDAQLPFSVLPHLLGLAPDRFWPGPYLHSAAPPAPRLPPRRPGCKRVALVWAGNPEHANDANRSMRLGDLDALLDMPGIDWVSLQRDRGPAELAAFTCSGRMQDLSPLLTDFSATASLLSEIDLLVTVDTAAAHLAGALSRPAWVLLPVNGDWRWGLAGESSRWYPSLRLFRQAQPGDWSTPLGEVAALLTNGSGANS